MTKTDFLKRIFSVLLCFALVVVGLGGFAPSTHAKNLNTLKAEQAELKEKVKESEKKIKELETAKAEQEKIIDELNKQIGQLNGQLENINAQQKVINDEIRAIEAKIKKLDDEIRQLDIEIAQKDVEIDNLVQLYCERLRANYIAGETSVLELFTASSSLSNFFNRLELFRRVTANDQKIVNQLNEEIKAIEEMKLKLEESKAEIEAEKATLEVKKAELQSAENELMATQSEIMAKSAEVSKKLQAINYQTKQLEVSIDNYNKEMDKVEADIDKFLQSQTSSTPMDPNSKGWIWPVPYSNSYITSPFGYRNDPISGVYKFHAGIDISMPGAMGKKLVAVKPGTVIRTVRSNSGYGNYVMIDHGGGFVSLYAHCKSLAVSNGQKVSQGQVIAYIGTSGYSTGPHVHFEIRKNGEKVNPSNYVSK